MYLVFWPRNSFCCYVEGTTHDYVSPGATTLFAALDVTNGEVIAKCKARHRHLEFLACLRHVDRNATSRPFVWTATVDSALAKVERLALSISGTRH